jgi:hypothetical protein
VVLGDVVGLGILLVACLIFGEAEYAAALKFPFWCEEAGVPCAPTGSADFRRIAFFGIIAMAQAMALYIISAAWERRTERTHFDPRWR